MAMLYDMGSVQWINFKEPLHVRTASSLLGETRVLAMSSLTDVDAQRTIDETISQHEETISEFEARILELKTMISEAEATILTLKTRRNTHCAISKLPAELIANVFLHAKRFTQQSNSTDDQSEQSSCYDDDERDYDRSWLNVSSVCRQWRAIVLDTPQLWCSIHLGAERALEFLKRSKSLPLHVWCASEYYLGGFDCPATKAVLASTQRIQELDVVFHEPSSLAQLLRFNPSGSAPALKVLKLKLKYPLYNDSLPLPKGVFWHDMPALQVLELKHVSPRSPLPMLPLLTRLVLRRQRGSWLIQSLRNTPLIEEIDILSLSSDFGTETTPVSLSKLTSLHIRTRRLSASKIFDLIEYPCSTVVDCKFTRLAVDNETSDLSILRRVYSRAVDGGIGLVQIDVKGPGFVVHLWPSDGQSPPCLTLRLPPPFPHRITQYLQLCSMVGASCHELSLIGFENRGTEEMLAVWPFFHQSTTLRLTRCSAYTLLSLLRTSDTQRPPLEKLKIIVIRKCSFNFPDRRRNNAICDAMIRVLQQREEGGMPIRTLIVRNCDITKDVINEFQSHVNVQWENDNDDDSDDDDNDDDDGYDYDYNDYFDDTDDDDDDDDDDGSDRD